METEQKFVTKKANIEYLKSLVKKKNIAEDLDDELLEKIGKEVVENTEYDDSTMEEWRQKYNDALKIAKQIIDKKNYPFPNASNVKIPLILQGCIQSNARIMPEIVQNNKTVYVEVMGKASFDDEDKCTRISDHMSLQTTKNVSNWLSDTDTLLTTLALTGTMYRKWVFDPIEKKPKTFLCLPTDIIIRNDVSSLATAPRITHILRLSNEEVISNIRAGLFLNIGLPNTQKDKTILDENLSSSDNPKVNTESLQSTTHSFIFYEQQCYWDLDDDGYAEPYIITVMRDTKQVARIVANYDEKSFIIQKGELLKIIPFKHYVAYKYLTSVDGTFLGTGLGQLLTHMNEAMNSVINNLIDAGTLANTRCGFMGSELRLPSGEYPFTPGEWKQVSNIPGQALSNSFFPLPQSEPSQTLMALLQFLLEFGKQIANVNDVLMGNPNMAQLPATSVVTLVEQGSKVFSSILSRVYEALKEEFSILYRLNKKYIKYYADIDRMTADNFVSPEDYEADDYNILPVANPSFGTDATRMAKMQVVMQIESPYINQIERLRLYFKMLGLTDNDIAKILIPEEQAKQPSAQDLLNQALMQKAQAEANYINNKAARSIGELEIDALRLELKEKELQIDAAYKAGVLAYNKANSIATLATAEAKSTSNDIAMAKNLLDYEQKMSTVATDMTGLEQRTQTLEASASAPPQGAQQGAPQGAQAPPSGGVEVAPELQQQLSAISQQQ